MRFQVLGVDEGIKIPPGFGYLIGFAKVEEVIDAVGCFVVMRSYAWLFRFKCIMRWYQLNRDWIYRNKEVEVKHKFVGVAH